ncbi:MAG: precorrin-6A/cobalt-precorrin-6A reductase, partial [Prevotella sp.]|nr:precorrin-6A/cobalt-precorrin-6A reductase [Prevotella sp.]
MIIVFGGTTEGRRAAQVLEEAGQPFWYSTRNDEQDVTLVHGIRLSGGMEANDMIQFVKDHDIRLLVDAAHPFATLLHTHILQAAEQCHIPVIRFDRQYPPHDEDICWCDDYEDAIRQLHQQGITRLLALTGVQTINKLKGYWQEKENTCWFRILDRDQSRDIAKRNGFPQ